MDQITVVHQFTDQGIDLAQTQGGLWTTLQVATHETIFVHAHLEGCRASFIDGSGAMLFCECENTQDAAHAHFALLAIDKVAERTDMGPTRPAPMTLHEAKVFCCSRDCEITAKEILGRLHH